MTWPIFVLRVTWLCSVEGWVGRIMARADCKRMATLEFSIVLGLSVPAFVRRTRALRSGAAPALPARMFAAIPRHFELAKGLLEVES